MAKPNPIDQELDKARAELAPIHQDMLLGDQTAHLVAALRAVIAAIEGLRR